MTITDNLLLCNRKFIDRHRGINDTGHKIIKCFLRFLFQFQVLFLVILRTVLPCVASSAKVNLQAVFFGQLAVCNATENMVFFKVRHPAAQVTFPFCLHDAFPHCANALSSSSRLNRNGICICSA